MKRGLGYVLGAAAVLIGPAEAQQACPVSIDQVAAFAERLEGTKSVIEETAAEGVVGERRIVRLKREAAFLQSAIARMRKAANQ